MFFAQHDKYTAESYTFACLDGSAEISADLINDDYCDCADGSDGEAA